MEKTIYDASNGLWYELRGDYYIPCLTKPAQEERPIDVWGQRHLRYIKKERKAQESTGTVLADSANQRGPVNENTA